MGHLHSRVYSYGQLARLSGVPRRTIVNWLDGTVEKPRRWQSVAQVAMALDLSAEETDALLRAAGLPTLRTLHAQSCHPADLALLAHWPPGAQDPRPVPVGPTADQSLLLRYCRQVIAAHVPLDADFPPSATFTFEEIFQDPEVRPLRRTSGDEELEGHLVGGHGATADGVLWSSLRDQLRRAVIVGQPGSGKRWLLRHEAVRLARAALTSGDPAARIPFLVSLSDLAAHLTWPVMPDQVLRAVAQQCTIQAVGRMDAPLLAALTHILLDQPGRAVLLLDGSDDPVESPEDVAAIRRALDHLARLGPGLILVTVQPLGYTGSPFVLEDASHDVELELAPLREIPIARVVRSWYHDRPERSEAFLVMLRQSPALAAQATNPRLLHVYCRLLAELDLHEMPQSGQLQRRALAMMLQRSGGARREVAPGRAKWQVKASLLEQLAWRMACYRGRWHWHLPGDVLESMLDDLPDAHLVAAEGHACFNGHYSGVLWELSAQDGLLVKGNVPGDGLLSGVPYAFLHQTVHTYLAARHLLKQIEQHGADTPMLLGLSGRDLHHPGWHAVISLLVEYAAPGMQPTPQAEALRAWLLASLRDSNHLPRCPQHSVWLAQLVARPPAQPAEAQDRPGCNADEDQALRQELVTVMRSPEVPIRLRVTAGRTLNNLGDPRPAIMDVDAIEFLAIPEGEHIQGSDPAHDSHAHADEQPAHVLHLPAYWISRYPISQAQFAQFLRSQPNPYTVERYWREAAALGHWRAGEVLHATRWYGATGVLESVPRWSRAPEPLGWPYELPNHPVCGTGWYEARAFACWLGERWRARGLLAGNQELDLPSEPEWEKGARGLSGHIYPWGNTFEPDALAWDGQRLMSSVPIGLFPAGSSPYGVEEMCGNLWEWTSTVYGPYPLDAASQIPMGAALRPADQIVVRGGAHFNTLSNCRAARRQHGTPMGRLHTTFRLVIRTHT